MKQCAFPSEYKYIFPYPLEIFPTIIPLTYSTLLFRWPVVYPTWALALIMARVDMKIIGQVVVAMTAVLVSTLLIKLYQARSLVRRLQKQGYVREETAKAAASL